MPTARSGKAAVLLGALCVATLIGGPGAEGETLAIRAGLIETVAGDPIENGVIVIVDGRIEAVGADVEVPEGAEVIDAQGGTVVPGFVAALTGLGLSAPAGSKPASNAHLRAADELYPYHDSLKQAARSGITTLALHPSGLGIVGQAALVRSVADTAEDMLLSDRGPLVIGFRADTDTKKLIKGALEAAAKGPSSDPKTAPLGWAMEGEIPTTVVCADAGEVVHVLELLEPHKKMKVMLSCRGADLYRIAEDLGKREMSIAIPAAITFETHTRTRVSIPRLLAEAGAKVALLGSTTEDRYRHEVAEQVKAGMDRATALRAMTIHPAEMIGLDYRLGSIEAGKDANFVVLSGGVFDARSVIQRVLIEGETVYDAAWGGLR